MTDDPTVDGRRRDDIRAHLESIAPTYTDEWEPGGDGAGDAVVTLFTTMAGELVERLDHAPAKHRVAFFDTLGFSRRPPQSATVPVAFTIAEDAGENAAIEAGTELAAETDEAELRFRVGTGEGFEATPARLRSVYSVDAAEDRLFAHHETIDGASGSTVFDGDDLQENVLYIGHPERLSMSNVSRIRVDVESRDGDPSRLEWQYYGEPKADEEEDAEVEETWHDLEWHDQYLALKSAGTLTETTVNGVESAWIRCRVPAEETPTGPFDIAFDDVSFPSDTDSTDTGINTVAPDRLFANDVPQPIDERRIYPFGSIPRQRDSFYIACEEAFTKRGAEVTIRFNRFEILDDIDFLDHMSPEEISLATEILTEVEATGVESQAFQELQGLARRLDDRHYTGAEYIGYPIGGSSDADFERLSHQVPTLVADNPELAREIVDQWEKDGDNEEDDDPRLSWEYWDGDAWSVLPITKDETKSLTKRGGTLTFDVPDDIDSTSVAGKDGVWIRARIVAGDYVDVRYVEANDDGTGEDGNDNDEAAYVRRIIGEPPAFDSMFIDYTYDNDVSPTYLFPKNNREFGTNLAGRDDRFRPFEPLPDRTQTVYFGFDGPLRGGPIQFYVDVADRTYPDDFTPRVSWEYLADPETNTWKRLHGQDGTDGFTEPGIVSLAFPEETQASRRFGEERHWIRARIRGDEFDDGTDAVEDRLEASEPDSFDTSRENGDSDDCTGLERCRPVLGTSVPSGLPTTAPPDVQGIYLNAGRVANVSVVEDERLGSSDGSPNATFSVARPPVVDLEVWVDELNARSTPDRERLREEMPDRIDVRRDRSGDVIAFWVRWTPVDDFIGSDADDRHYVVDRVAGTITFGDGSAGRIPPHGRDNIRTTYRTGGGAAGNVAPGAVADLVSPVPLVEEVTNPIPGSGGAPPESTAAVLERAPKTLRDRGRAVTAADFERIAMDASRRLAEVSCIPGMNRAGEHEPGWVTIVIVPDDRRETPVPSAELRRQVRQAVSDRAPLSLVAADELVVREPSYVAVRADATLVADKGTRLGAVEDRVDNRLSAFLHPLSGAGGDGWGFGELPTISDVYTLMEGCEGVDHVASLHLQYAGDREDVTITGGETPPETTPDVLVRSGTHDLVVEPSTDPCEEAD